MKKNIRGLAKAISEISYKSRNKGLTPDDIMDGTFSITNYGVFGAFCLAHQLLINLKSQFLVLVQ
ncbi:MAG: 2-oxo acid dehydrogenase subunit E2 [Ignavibacteriales bacterium]|nr:2-oxo acid dehydrogenase subunit E2 [Ignavibacteriales bacterium]